MDAQLKKEQCRLEQQTPDAYAHQLPELVARLAETCRRGDCCEHISPMPLPKREAVESLIHLAREIVFPGYFNSMPLDAANLEYYLGLLTSRLFDQLATQVSHAIRHDCYRYDQTCQECIDRGRQVALDFIQELPSLREMLALDVAAALEGDPACQSRDEVIFSYPGLLAISIQRMAHLLYHQKVPLLPRILTEYAHARTGIDIHPGAHIGQSFFIDHGTGVVIGETARLGDRVRLYQGVTLGALSLPRKAGEKLKGVQRHPTIEDEVIIYAGATILGGDTVIGARSVVGGNVWITESVPPDSKVLLKQPELVLLGPKV